MTPVMAETDSGCDAPAVKLVGRFLVDDRGYSIINEDGQVIAYFDRTAVNWNGNDVRKFDGLEVNMTLFPGGEVLVVPCSQ